MVPNILLYQLLLVALVLLCLLIQVWWSDHPSPTPPSSLKPDNPRRNRSKEPNRSRDIFTNRYARPVRRASIRAPRCPARHLLFSPSSEAASAPSTHNPTSVPSPIVLTRVGSDGATSAPTWTQPQTV